MHSGRPSPWSFSLVAGVLIAAFLAQSFLASRTKSPVYDEPTDLAAALSYLQFGRIRANLQHPPLLKEVIGASLRLGGMALPSTPEVDAMRAGKGGDRMVGNRLIEGSGAARVMFWARLPMILLAGLLGLLIYLWGRKLAGETAAVAALALYAVDPTLLAHSFLATMDVGLATFTVLFFLALWSYLERPDNLRLVLCGLSLGAVLAAKFSAIFWVPVAILLVIAAVRRPPEGADSKRPALFHLYGHGWGESTCAVLAIAVLAMLVIQAVYLSPDGLHLYRLGLDRVNADHAAGTRAYLGGQLQPWFASYFTVAYLLKEPIPNLVLAAIGLVALLRSRRISSLAKLFLVVPLAVFLVVHSLWADALGIRYLIPLLPFAWLVAGVGVSWLVESQGSWGKPLVAVLGLWLLVTAAGIYPDHLAYFNEAACLPGSVGRIGMDGGTACGPQWLAESNVDWGQGLIQLKAWLDRNAPGRPVRMAYFGSVAPSAYGLTSTEVIKLPDLADPPPGLYVVSAHFVAVGPGLLEARGAWLSNTKPLAVVGHSLYVFERR